MTEVPDWLPTIAEIAGEHNVSMPAWLSILWAESAGNPNARGDLQPDGSYCSFGLFQLNTCGGQGQGYDPEDLVDPVFNARIAMVAIGEAAANCSADDICCIATNSGHPGHVSCDDSRILNIKRLFDLLRPLETLGRMWDALTGGNYDPPPPPPQPVPPGPPDPWDPNPGGGGGGLLGSWLTPDAVKATGRRVAYVVILLALGLLLIGAGIAMLAGPKVAQVAREVAHV